MKYLVAIMGPTASGKTGTAIGLAQHYHTAVLSADSRQLFCEMSIGTAKPTPEELAAAPHYFIDHVSIAEDYSAGRFELEALDILGTLYQKRDVVVMTGGTGLYINALLNGFDDLPAVAPETREHLNNLYSQQGLPHLLDLLQQKDPDYYQQVDRNNPQRVIRALEVIVTTGKPYSSFRTGKVAQRPFKTIKIGLNQDRELLYQRIDARVDEMMKNGLLAEVERLLPHRHKNALQTVGYTELFDYLDGKTTLQEAVALIKRNTRHYAKRQLTWFRRDPETTWFDGTRLGEIIEYINQQMGREKDS